MAPSAFADQTKPVPAKDALGMFRVPDDVRVELVAAEPDVIDPVAVAFPEVSDGNRVRSTAY